jgi:hypothetical protein
MWIASRDAIKEHNFHHLKSQSRPGTGEARQGIAAQLIGKGEPASCFDKITRPGVEEPLLKEDTYAIKTWARL